jgi:hypothetical protein
MASTWIYGTKDGSNVLLPTNNTTRYQNTTTPRNYTTLLTGLPNSALSEDHHLERFLTWAQADFTERRFGWGGCRHILVMMVRLLLAGQDPLEHGDAGLLLSSRHITLCSNLLPCNKIPKTKSLLWNTDVLPNNILKGMFSLIKGDTGLQTSQIHSTKGNFNIILTFTSISVEVVLWVLGVSNKMFFFSSFFMSYTWPISLGFIDLMIFVKFWYATCYLFPLRFCDSVQHPISKHSKIETFNVRTTQKNKIGEVGVR